MATSSGLSSESCEPQEGKEVMVRCKGDTCTDSGAVPTTPRGVQPPSKEDKNLKEEGMSCKPASSVSAENRNLKRAGWGCVVGCGLLWECQCNSSSICNTCNSSAMAGSSLVSQPVFILGDRVKEERRGKIRSRTGQLASFS